MATEFTRLGGLPATQFLGDVERVFSIEHDTIRSLSLGDTITMVVKVLQDGCCGVSVAVQDATESDGGHETAPDSLHKVPDHASTG